MKVLVDENIARMTVDGLRALGHDVADVRGWYDEGREGSPTMNLTLPLTPAEEAKLLAKAREAGTTPEQVVRQAIEPILALFPNTSRRSRPRRNLSLAFGRSMGQGPRRKKSTKTVPRCFRPSVETTSPDCRRRGYPHCGLVPVQQSKTLGRRPRSN